MLSTGLYATPNIFTRVIHAPAELFLRDLQSLICWINPIIQTGPPPILTIFARSIGAYIHQNCLHTPICDYVELSCLGPEPPTPLRPSILTIPSYNHYSATFLPILDSHFSQSLCLGTYASYALHSYIYMPPLPQIGRAHV